MCCNRKIPEMFCFLHVDIYSKKDGQVWKSWGKYLNSNLFNFLNYDTSVIYILLQVVLKTPGISVVHTVTDIPALPVVVVKWSCRLLTGQGSR